MLEFGYTGLSVSLQKDVLEHVVTFQTFSQKINTFWSKIEVDVLSQLSQRMFQALELFRIDFKRLEREKAVQRKLVNSYLKRSSLGLIF